MWFRRRFQQLILLIERFRQGWFLGGKNPIPEIVIRSAEHPLFGALIAICMLWVGVCASLFSADIKDATDLFVRRLFLLRFSGAVHWVTCAFYAALLIFPVGTYLQFLVKRIRDDRRITELAAAVHEMPNPRAIEHFISDYRMVREILSSQEDPSQKLIALLATLRHFAAQFADRAERRYGVNIMIASDREELDESLVLFADPSRRFSFHPKILVLDEEFALPAFLGRYTASALPIPEQAFDQETQLPLAFPGAPWTFLTGEMVVIPDTSEIFDAPGDFLQSERERMRSFFSLAGQGRFLKSFVSIRLEYGGEPIGIVNIDSSETDLLGTSASFYSLFEALSMPIVDAIATVLAQLNRARDEP